MSQRMSSALGKAGVSTSKGSCTRKSTRSPSRYPSYTDIWIYRIVVSFLGATILTAITGGILLQINGTDTPPIVTALGTGALGAMTTLLAASPMSNSIRKTRK